MEVNELMIGDWVMLRNTPAWITAINPSNGYAITKDQISVRISDDTSMGVDIDKVEPILISADILERNGYTIATLDNGWTAKITGYDWVMHWCENYFVALKQHRLNCWKIHVQGDSVNLDGGVSSVHELQHALRLAGIKKEIVL